MSDALTSAADARQQFMDLVAGIRPELHRYCTRMTGSVLDGEDVVQDTLAKAWYALATMESVPPLRPWLFRIAHNAAMDFLRRYEHRHQDTDADLDSAVHSMQARDPDGHAPDDALVEQALHVFATLPPLQRGVLALKDVLGLSLQETADTIGATVPAVKAALVRARATVAAPAAARARPVASADILRLQRYALLFNARDWDALRALFSDETRLELVSRHQRRAGAAAQYFTQYERLAPAEQLRAVAGWQDGVPLIAMFRGESAARPAYFVTCGWRDELAIAVRDYYYVPYVATEAEFLAAS